MFLKDFCHVIFCKRLPPCYFWTCVMLRFCKRNVHFLYQFRFELDFLVWVNWCDHSTLLRGTNNCAVLFFRAESNRVSKFPERQFGHLFPVFRKNCCEIVFGRLSNRTLWISGVQVDHSAQTVVQNVCATISDRIRTESLNFRRFDSVSCFLSENVAISFLDSLKLEPLSSWAPVWPFCPNLGKMLRDIFPTISLLEVNSCDIIF